ncbi:MAG: outer membrane beta-barrel protein [Woeseiaceae bacterium]|nr:outer membrane beta-barrel protein [Woeseiaceae bacterium]
MLRSAHLVILLAFAASAGAQDFGYTYLQASYGAVSFDDSIVDVDGDGLGISGSWGFHPDFYAAAEYQTADMDFGVDLNILELAVGWHTPLSEQLDFTAQLGYLEAEVESGFGSADDDGLMLGAGLRGQLTDAVELNGGIDYIDFDQGGGETRANAGFLFNLTDTLTVGAEASFWDDINVYQLNLRFDFE